jgi:hypothetical protein
MRKHDNYLRACEQCRANAEKTGMQEIRQLWITIADSYRFLAKLEARARHWNDFFPESQSVFGEQEASR